MQFITDENLPAEVTELLRREGHDALSAIDLQLAGRTDYEQVAASWAEQRVLITLELGFSDLRSYPLEDYFGMIILRPGIQSITSILQLTERTMIFLNTESPIGKLWIVEDHQIRIRGENT